jgi:hypothetical protein
MGFKRLSSDARLFVYKAKNGQFVIAVIYVDDALFLGPDKSLIAKVKAIFMAKWECRDLGEAKEFLRMRIKRKGQLLMINQQPYLEKVLECYDMQNAKAAPTPLPAGYYPVPSTEEASPELRQGYQGIIGSLLYLMLGTRPDIAFAITKLAQFAANPSKEHYKKAQYVCRYLVGTKDYTLVYNGAQEGGLTAYCDSDWAADPSARRSQTGYFFKLARGLISWTSRAQKSVARSVTEAEYMSLSDCCGQAFWLKQLLGELGYNLEPIPVNGDNQGSIHIGQAPVTNSTAKHIAICYHYVREKVEEEVVKLFYIPGEDNPADFLTKNLGHIKFEKFRSQLGLYFF